MSTLRKLAIAALAPSPSALWHVRGALRAAEAPSGSPIFPILEAFHAFLVRWQAAASGERYSERASRLDLAALGGLAAEELVTAEDSRELATRLLGGLVSEGLAFAATRQHVRAWRGEVSALLEETAWSLSGLLWEWSSRRRPELDAAQRSSLVEQLVAVVRDSAVDPGGRALIATRLFQVMALDEAAAGFE